MKTTGTLTTDASGVIDDVFNLHNTNHSINGGTAYTYSANYLQLYDQYRVRAIKIELFPRAPSDETTTTVYRPIVLAYDRDSDSAFTTFDGACSFGGSKVYNVNRKITYYRKLSKVAPAEQVMPGGWMDCAAPTDYGAIKTFASDLSVSKLYFVYKVTIYCQFKNRL